VTRGVRDETRIGLDGGRIRGCHRYRGGHGFVVEEAEVLYWALRSCQGSRAKRSAPSSMKQQQQKKIVSAVERARDEGIDVSGPLPADTVSFRAGRGDFDLVVAMYHDQGHGPVKVLGLEAGVNITVGLPVTGRASITAPHAT
jgi:hypothetical protein